MGEGIAISFLDSRLIAKVKSIQDRNGTRENPQAEFCSRNQKKDKDKKLPVTLSREEVSRIPSSVTNLKHETILVFTYSAGLRVGE